MVEYCLACVKGFGAASASRHVVQTLFDVFGKADDGHERRHMNIAGGVSLTGGSRHTSGGGRRRSMFGCQRAIGRSPLRGRPLFLIRLEHGRVGLEMEVTDFTG